MQRGDAGNVGWEGDAGVDVDGDEDVGVDVDIHCLERGGDHRTKG